MVDLLLGVILKECYFFPFFHLKIQLNLSNKKAASLNCSRQQYMHTSANQVFTLAVSCWNIWVFHEQYEKWKNCHSQKGTFVFRSQTYNSTAVVVLICFVLSYRRCRLLLFLTFYICLSKQLDECLFVSVMLSSLLFTLQIELHIARNSCEAFLKYKKGYPKLSMITIQFKP